MGETQNQTATTADPLTLISHHFIPFSVVRGRDCPTCRTVGAVKEDDSTMSQTTVSPAIEPSSQVSDRELSGAAAEGRQSGGRFAGMTPASGGAASAAVAVPARPARGEFDYRPVPALAPVALILGIASALSLLGLALTLIVAVPGLIVGLVAFVKIRRSQGELGGSKMAVTGLLLSAVFLTAGVAKDRYLYHTEVPEGHIRVNFPKDIAEKGFVFENGRRKLHPDVEKLEGRKVFLKGYMWNTTATTGISEFLLLKDNGQCCFGGKPKATDMIIVRVEDPRGVDKKAGLVAVAGTLECRPENRPMNPDGTGAPVYFLKATHFGRALTPY